MTGIPWRQWGTLLLLLLGIASTGARAEPLTGYAITGPMGAVVEGPALGDETETEVLLFAFSRLTPIPPEVPVDAPPAKLPPPGPRLVFVVTRWVPIGSEWVLRQWSGDVPLEAEALGITANLAQGKLDATVLGTLTEYRENGKSVQPEVPGRLQVQWVASGNLAQTTLAYSLQVPSYTLVLQTAGSGRKANVTATLTVEALGAPISLSAPGRLSLVQGGLLGLALP